MTWLFQRFSSGDVLKRLLDPYAYEGCDSANSFHRNLRLHRPDLGLPPALDDPNPSKCLARRWCTPERMGQSDCPAPVLETLLQVHPSLSEILGPLILPGLEKGDQHFVFDDSGVTSKSVTVPLCSGVREVLLSQVWVYAIDRAFGTGRLLASPSLPDLALLFSKGQLHVRVAPRPRVLEGRLSLCRDRLENAATDAICYGAKDTGEMGGGAAIAVSQACGPELLEALREGLAQSSREVGEVVITSAFHHPGASYVGHLISIKTRTSQGDWCPSPERLGDGVYTALRKLDCLDGAKTVAFSCLATGEGRAQPAQVAALMLGAAKKYFKENPNSRLRVLFCLPNYRDYQAFEKAMA